jgi:hypothetical protein
MGGIAARAWLAIALPVLLAAGCAAPPPPAIAPPGTAFRFSDDVFAFSNQTLWLYRVDPSTGRFTGVPREDPPDFAFRCAGMARATRQFFTGARFDPTTPRLDQAGYTQRVRQVLATDPRHPPAERVVIPGYRDLHEFSQAEETLLKALLPGAAPSYFQRGNWRMIYPFSGRHQAAMAERLRRELAAGWLPIVHVMRFPERSINHFVLVLEAEETLEEIRFQVYDPNDEDGPVTLRYDRGAHVFSYPPMRFFVGGPVKVYEVYDGWLY